MRLSMKHKNINLPKSSGALTNDKKPLKAEGVLQAQLTLSGSSDSQKGKSKSMFSIRCIINGLLFCEITYGVVVALKPLGVGLRLFPALPSIEHLC